MYINSLVALRVEQALLQLQQLLQAGGSRGSRALRKHLRGWNLSGGLRLPDGQDLQIQHTV